VHFYGNGSLIVSLLMNATIVVVADNDNDGATLMCARKLAGFMP